MPMKIPPALIANPISFLYKLWCNSLNFQQVGRRHVEKLIEDNTSFILAVWHDEIFSCIHAKQDAKIVTVVSQSKDGEYLARVLENIGFATARGSSSRGGLSAMIQAARYIRDEGYSACISVDGPRGPRHEVKEGAIFLAHKVKIPIIPMRAVMTRGKVFNSWDRFQLPWPFSTVTIYFGAPYYIEAEELTADILKRECAKLKVKLEIETIRAADIQ